MAVKAQIKYIVQLLSKMLRLLVDEPDKLRVQVCEDASTYLLQVSVPRSDVGKLIVVQGQTARSIRILLAAMATPLKTKIRLDIQALESLKEV